MISMESKVERKGELATLAPLRQKMVDKIGAMRAEGKRLLKEHGERQLSRVTVAQAYGGMRGVKCMVTETSSVDPYEGIRFRGYSIPELRAELPKARGGAEPLPEGVFHLLLTGELPTADEVADITKTGRRNETLPEHVKRTLDELSTDAHPMTQFSVGIMAMQNDSIFAREYRRGIKKSEYWSAMFDDALVLLARLPLLAAYIYRRTYKEGNHIPPAGKELDWAGNLAHMMGVEEGAFKELMRLYLAIHADHEGGNVSAHTTHLVGSALSDPYLSLSAGMNGLAGPLHGLANQEVVRWIMQLKQRLGETPTREQIVQYVWDTLNQGQVVPGYGHAVLRRTDPRYTAQREFALQHMPDDENFKIVQMLFDEVPGILKEQGKAKNPWPNVDAHSGCLLIHYGIVEYDFYTVLFGVSRALGVISSLIWDRALMLPLERPKSVTTEWIENEIGAGRLE
jgi:citrate synthase